MRPTAAAPLIAPPLISGPPPPISPLLLSDQLITLAEQAGQAGYRQAARRLLALACRMLADPPLVPSRSMAIASPASAERPRYRSPGAGRRPGR